MQDKIVFVLGAGFYRGCTAVNTSSMARASLWLLRVFAERIVTTSPLVRLPPIVVVLGENPK
jgi:hypothetical protein